MIERASEWFRRAVDVWRTDGFASMVTRGTETARSWLFQWQTFYFYEHSIEERNPADFKPRIENTTVRIVRTIEDAEELAVATGYDLLHRFVGTRRRLHNSAIAFCIFVDGEIAHIGWVALSEEAKKTVDAQRYKVNFANNEASTGGTETVPKFQGKGLMTRAVGVFVDHLFSEEGMNRVCARIMTENGRSRALVERLGLTLEGVHRDSYKLRGEYKDMTTYSILRPEWKTRYG